MNRLCRFHIVALIVLLSLTGRQMCIAEESPVTAQSGNSTNAVSQNDVEYLKKQILDLRGAVAAMKQELTDSRLERQELLQTLKAVQSRLGNMDRPNIQTVSKVSVETNPSSMDIQQTDDADHSGNRVDPESIASLETKVDDLREEQHLIASKVETQYQTKVESSANYRIRLSGMMLMNVFSTRGAVDNLDLPTVAEERGALASNGAFGASLRQTVLGLEVFGPIFAGAKTRADVSFDFFGGFPATENGTPFGIVRLRSAKATFDWANTTLVAGQDVPFISPLSPSSLSSTAVASLYYSGNIWTLTPQVFLEHRMATSENSHVLLQGGILDPLTGAEPPSSFYRETNPGESSRQPAYAARAGWSQAVPGGAMTVAVGVYFSRQHWGLGRNVNAWAATADWEIPLGSRFALSGEFYRGTALGGLGVGNSSSVILSGPSEEFLDPIHTAGGWTQLKFKPASRIEFNSAFGEDYVLGTNRLRLSRDNKISNELYRRNATAIENVIVHVRSNLLFSAEYRRIWTTSAFGSRRTADHVDFSAGILF